MKIKKSSFLGVCFLALFLYLGILYFWFFYIENFSSELGHLVFNIANQHDHEIYIQYIEDSEGVFYLNISDNNIGVSFLYYVLAKIFPFSGPMRFETLSLFVNCIVLAATYNIYLRICNKLRLGLFAKAIFFSNLYLIYFLQLINKDLLTILVILYSISLGLRGKSARLILLIPFAILIRQQLAIFIVIYFLLINSKRPLVAAFIIYTITSLFAAMLSNNNILISEETLGTGFSGLVSDFNKNFYVGYFLTNPIRIIQYIYDVMLSFIFFNESSQMDLAKILRIPHIITMFFLFKPIFLSVLNVNFIFNSPARYLHLAILAFLMTWLINPTVNARYAFLITNVVLLLGVFYLKFNKKYEKSTYHRRI